MNNSFLKIILLSFLIGAFFIKSLGFNFIVNAQESGDYSISSERVNPDNIILYKFKRVIEKTKENVYKKFQREKTSDYYLILSKKRLSELYFLSKNDKASYIEISASRYQTTLGQLEESGLSKIDDKDKFVKELNNQIIVLKYLLTREIYNSSEWLLIKQSLETVQRVYSIVET